MQRIYVGWNKDGTKEVFKADSEPTRESHGETYLMAWGPFRTMKAASFAASPATNNNPHTQTVADCERIVKGG